MWKVILVIAIWLLGISCIKLMKKIEPNNKIYPSAAFLVFSESQFFVGFRAFLLAEILLGRFDAVFHQPSGMEVLQDVRSVFSNK